VNAPSTGRPDSQWEQRRRAILDGAAEVFFEHGFHRGTTKEIAEKVGLTQPAIYHYVGSKDDLLAEIARQVDRDFSHALEASISSSTDPVEQLISLIHSFVEMLVLNQRTFAVYWKEQNAIPEAARAETEADQRAYVRRIEAVVAEVQRAGALPAQHDTHIVAEAIIGMMSWLYWWYRPDAGYDEPQIAQAFCDLIGLTPRG
jgi:AcrR family transcriptional regulator